MENYNLEVNTKVRLTDIAIRDTYSDMDWKNEDLIITDACEDSEGMGLIYSFDSLDTDNEITCSLYGYELELI